MELKYLLSRIVFKKTDEWYIKWQRVVQRETTRDNDWQQMTTSDNEWQGVVVLADFLLIFFSNKRGTYQYAL